MKPTVNADKREINTIFSTLALGWTNGNANTSKAIALARINIKPTNDGHAPLIVRAPLDQKTEAALTTDPLTSKKGRNIVRTARTASAVANPIKNILVSFFINLPPKTNNILIKISYLSNKKPID